MTTGEKIRTRRKELGISVDELAAQVGKNRATIYRYESDAIEMPAGMLKPLADALDTTPDDLMDWNTLLKDIAEHDKKLGSVLPLLENGVSVTGGTHSYILLKAPSRSGRLAHNLCSLLSVLYQLNSANCDAEMYGIRVLAEMASTFDAKSLEHLISYAEFLDAKHQKKTGISIEHPYQFEQSASLELE